MVSRDGNLERVGVSRVDSARSIISAVKNWQKFQVVILKTYLD